MGKIIVALVFNDKTLVDSNDLKFYQKKQKLSRKLPKA